MPDTLGTAVQTKDKMATIRSWGAHCAPILYAENVELLLRIKQQLGDSVWLDLRDEWNPIAQMQEELEEAEDEKAQLEDRVHELEAALDEAESEKEAAIEDADHRYYELVEEAKEHLAKAQRALEDV